jgi:hypothetical protein
MSFVSELNPRQLRRGDFFRVEDRVEQELPPPEDFHDFRYILHGQDWSDKIFDFRVEIECRSGEEVNIKNCYFKKGLIIRLESEVYLQNIYIVGCDIDDPLKIYGYDHECNVVNKEVSIDTCNIEKIETIMIKAEAFRVYKCLIKEMLFEASDVARFIVEKSSIGFLLEYGNRFGDVDIQEGCFKEFGIVPHNLMNNLNARYNNINHAREATLRSIDLLIRNKNVCYPSHESSSLFYARAKVQSSSVVINFTLWLFGYFHSVTRYLSTSMIMLFVVFISLGAASIISGDNFDNIELLRLSINSFLGLSNTLSEGNNSFLLSVVTSISIGMGTVFYSGLLVTLINRFRVRF